MVFISLVAHAQVANDNVENRRVVRAEELVTSTTVGCTVQRGCVDERLTGQCIEYHNDQWFEFTPREPGTYYVNVSGQKCRDLRGVQLVVLTGTPCQPATYHILSCTSFGTQDDLFVALPNLQAGQPYLLDVDGYLKDYCGFTLQVSGRARGLPAATAGVVSPAPIATPSREVRLTWQMPDSLAAASYCRVLRREQHEFRAREIGRVPLEHDTYGRLQPDYALLDTLPAAGNYLYQVVAEREASPSAAGPPVIFRQRWISYTLPQQQPGSAAFLDLPLGRYPPGATLRVVIRDAASGQVLRKLPVEPGQAGSLRRVYAQDWVRAGIRQVAVAITCYPPSSPATTDQLLLPLQPE